MVRVYPIIRAGDWTERPAAVCSLIDSGIRYLQIRGGSVRAILASCRDILPLCHKSSVTLIVNDRADLAWAVGTGVHLGQDDFPVVEARKMLGPDAIIGRSTHSESEYRAALELAVEKAKLIDYVAVGPIYPTDSKMDARDVVGVELVSKAAGFRTCKGLDGSSLPLVAIGGIRLENYRECLVAGADYVAAIGVFRDAEDRLRHDAGEVAAQFTL